MLTLGTVLENKYRITKLLGKGGWGSVYLAEHMQLGNLWAIKEIDLSRQGRVNLLAEPEILKKLKHPSLPRIIDIFQLDKCLYIVEDYFAGVSLKELLKEREACSEQNVLMWARQLTEILNYLHQQQPHPIIYRDLKPANVIIDDQHNARLIDFGVAREYKPEQEEDTVYIGTRGYAAPEQYAAAGQTDARTDIYGLGATLYHVLTGISPDLHPWQMPPVRQVNPAISVELEQIITGCLAYDPQQRYQSAQELLADINLLLTDEDSPGLFNDTATLRGGNQRARLVVVERPIGPVVIGIGGTSRGVGCTHLTLALGAFFVRRKVKVAVLEIHDHPVFYTLLEENTPQGRLPGSFRFQGMDMYRGNPDNQQHRLIELLRGGYDYVLLDVGQCLQVNNHGVVEFTPGYQEMTRANLRILVAGAALWQLKDLAPYLQQPEQWQLVFRTPSPGIFRQLQGELDYPLYSFGLQLDPFELHPDQQVMFEKLLRPYLPQQTARKPLFRFWT